MSKPLEVEIWTDIACPWCYIGKTNFEQALEKFPHQDDVQVRFKAFQIDPNSPVETGMNLDEMFSHLHQVSMEEARRYNARLEEMASQSGLHYDLLHAIRTNSMDGLRLVYLARESGREAEMLKRLMKAYLEEGQHIGRHDVLKKLAEEVGLDGDQVARTLESDAYLDEILTDRILADAMGVSGVPFFVFNQKYALSGAQSADTFEKVFEQIWQQEVPAVSSKTPDADCQNGSCAVKS